MHHFAPLLIGMAVAPIVVVVAPVVVVAAADIFDVVDDVEDVLMDVVVSFVLHLLVVAPCLD